MLVTIRLRAFETGLVFIRLGLRFRCARAINAPSQMKISDQEVLTFQTPEQLVAIRYACEIIPRAGGDALLVKCPKFFSRRARFEIQTGRDG